MINIYVIIPAAGMGRRMGEGVTKQFLQIFDKTILEYSANIFLNWEMITKMVIPLSDLSLAPFNHKKVNYCLGGETRFDSVAKALKQIKGIAEPDDWVIVHDAARPFLTTSELIRCFCKIKDDAIGGVVSSPVTDTVKHVDANGVIKETLDRSRLAAAQTPQFFRYQYLQKAFDKADKKCTDESMALESIGLKPRVIFTNQINTKITTRTDFDFFKFYLGNKLCE